jgi:hypothetical protein
LSPISNLRLQEKLKRELRPGARVVSYYHDMWGWKPAEVGESKGGYPLYLYRMGEVS